MTISFKIRILYLIAKLFAHALVVLDPLKLAGAVAVVLSDALLQISHEYVVRTQLRFHDVPPIRENNGACSPRSAGRGQSGKSA